MSDHHHEAPPPPSGHGATDPRQPRAEGESAGRLRWMVRAIDLGIVAYNLAALVLIFLSASRGRGVDAVLVAITALVITPLLLGSRRSAVERLGGIERRDGPPPAGGA